MARGGPILALGPLRISAFAVLVVGAVSVGFTVVSRRAEHFGLARPLAEQVVVWTIFWGFVCSRAVDLAAYQPRGLAEKPLELFRIWGGMSSYGGIFGGVAAALVVMRRKQMSGRDMLRFIDLVTFSFPFAWLARRPRPNGFYVALFFSVYGPARFLLDTLRTDDLRYLGRTPGQYASVVAALAGAAMFWAIVRGGSGRLETRDDEGGRASGP